MYQRKKLRPGDIARSITTANIHAQSRWKSEVIGSVYDNELFFVVSSRVINCDSESAFDQPTLMCYVVGHRNTGWIPEVYLERVA